MNTPIYYVDKFGFVLMYKYTKLGQNWCLGKHLEYLQGHHEINPVLSSHDYLFARSLGYSLLLCEKSSPGVYPHYFTSGLGDPRIAVINGKVITYRPDTNNFGFIKRPANWSAKHDSHNNTTKYQSIVSCNNESGKCVYSAKFIVLYKSNNRLYYFIRWFKDNKVMQMTVGDNYPLINEIIESTATLLTAYTLD